MPTSITRQVCLDVRVECVCYHCISVHVLVAGISKAGARTWMRVLRYARVGVRARTCMFLVSPPAGECAHVATLGASQLVGHVEPHRIISLT